MDEDGGASPELGDRATSDVTVRLKNREGRPEWYHCHAVVLSRRSRFFAERLSVGATPRLSLSSAACVEIPSSGADYDHHVRLLKLLYRSEDPPWESWGSVATALGVLRAAVALGCDCVARSCVQYLEAMPWEEEEEEILRTVKDMGPAAAPILARIQPVDHSAAKEVLIAAIHFAAAAAPAEGTNELKISAQEQVEYMLTEDDEAPLLMADDDVKTEVRADLGRMFSALAAAMASLPAAAEEERRVLQALSDLEWLCGILPKMDLMKDFVSHWVRSSDDLLGEIQSERLCSGFWAVKAKMVELAGKALEAVGYGSVVLPAPARVRLLKGWLPFLRKTKAALDSPAVGEENSVQGLDSELCQTIEGAVVSMVLALPSNDQAEILTDWMTTGQVNFPDLSEAFEVWCYRAKAAKRRLAVGVDGAANPTVSL
ncbi:unnamed protein product [Spirodela intermedia]|uniref:BTB domain-containing protein n=1 Tax=Spirodela intermedia TaxID=51605 RepID=A0A7I8J9P7_SPIIN|nr:unnamed protein product [Spirodela intermedia]CAA6666877.1 unnamed protein product [Spirodela intermedia]